MFCWGQDDPRITVVGFKVKLLPMMAVPERTSVRSFPTTPSWPGLKIQVIRSNGPLMEISTKLAYRNTFSAVCRVLIESLVTVKTPIWNKMCRLLYTHLKLVNVTQALLSSHGIIKGFSWTIVDLWELSTFLQRPAYWISIRSLSNGCQDLMCHQSILFCFPSISIITVYFILLVIIPEPDISHDQW